MPAALKGIDGLGGPWKPLLQGKREGRSVVAIMVANKVPKGAKTTPFGNPNPTEIACLVSGLRVAVKTAKPLGLRDMNPSC